MQGAELKLTLERYGVWILRVEGKGFSDREKNTEELKNK